MAIYKGEDLLANISSSGSAPEELISDDQDNAIELGSDGKLLVTLDNNLMFESLQEMNDYLLSSSVKAGQLLIVKNTTNKTDVYVVNENLTVSVVSAIPGESLNRYENFPATLPVNSLLDYIKLIAPKAITSAEEPISVMVGVSGTKVPNWDDIPPGAIKNSSTAFNLRITYYTNASLTGHFNALVECLTKISSTAPVLSTRRMGLLTTTLEPSWTDVSWNILSIDDSFARKNTLNEFTAIQKMSSTVSLNQQAFRNIYAGTANPPSSMSVGTIYLQYE